MSEHPKSLPADASADEMAFVTAMGDRLAMDRRAAGTCPGPAMISAAVTGALPEPHQAVVMEHVAACASCRTLADDLADATDEADLAESRDRVWARVRAGIAAEQRDLVSGSSTRRAWWTRWPVLVPVGAFAVVLAVVVAGRMPLAMIGPEPPAVGVVSARFDPPAVSVLAVDLPPIAAVTPPPILWRGGSAMTPPSDDVGLALDAYRDGRFEMVVRTLEPFARAATLPVDARLALGVSWLHLGRWADAQAALLPIDTSHDPVLRDDASWYMALALARTGDVGEALDRVRHLCDGSGRRAAQACLAADELTRSRAPQPRMR